MVFSSVEFLFAFLPAFLLVYLIAPGFRNLVLLVFSILFYIIGEGLYVYVMIFSIVLNYIIGRKIGETVGGDRQHYLIFGVAANLTLLVFHKYIGFLYYDVLVQGESEFVDSIHLPIGISFFTFQSISYLVDVYRGDARAERSMLRLGAYVSMFPQLVAGPIVRFSTVEKHLRRRTVRLRQAYYGLAFFAVGLAQKVLIADSAASIADPIYAEAPGAVTAGAAWLGGLAYMVQIYFDFSGYSSMAIGLGLILGFKFPQNFNFPYIARSVTEFWRRWHLSLSSWFRDYVYIPLGGNRGSNAETYRNLFVIFLLTGIWHGASWNFVVWGLFHGGFLILERSGFSRFLEKAPSFVTSLYLLTIVYFGWIFFRAENLSHAFSYIGRLFSFSSDGLNLFAFLSHEAAIGLVLGVLLSTPLAQHWSKKILASPKYGAWEEEAQKYKYVIGAAAWLTLIGVCSVKIMAGSYSPFIYFRF